MPIYMLI